MMNWIDLRSDTVTWPTEEMRAAMAEAEVGDDVYGEDPTVNLLQERSADLMGHEAGLFVASGTMGNLAAVLAHCGRGDEVILGDLAHQFLKEAAGMAGLGGIQPRTVATLESGELPLEAVTEAVRADDPHHPRSRLICVENTHNFRCGAALGAEYTAELFRTAHKIGLKVHLDGARVFNAAAAFNLPIEALTKPVDSVTFCLSKGLCAPVGSVLCGSRPFIAEALRIRKALGGGMRQAGVLAAAGLVALDTMVDRLGEDHARARRLADGLEEVRGVTVLNPQPQTNMVCVEFPEPEAPEAAVFVERARAQEIRLKARGPRTMRLVTHYWITDDDVDQTIALFEKVLAEPAQA